MTTINILGVALIVIAFGIVTRWAHRIGVHHGIVYILNELDHAELDQPTPPPVEVGYANGSLSSTRTRK